MSHHSGVVYVSDGPDVQYYGVVCSCGFNETMDAAYPDARVEAHIVSVALDHDPLADTTVYFPLSRPENA